MVCRIVLLVSCFFFLIFAPGCQDEFGDSEAEFCILLLKIKFNYWTAVLLCSWPWLFVICHSRRKPWIALLQVLSYLGICTLRMFTSVYGSAMIVDFLAISTQGLFLIGGGGSEGCLSFTADLFWNILKVKKFKRWMVLLNADKFTFLFIEMNSLLGAFLNCAMAVWPHRHRFSVWY